MKKRDVEIMQIIAWILGFAALGFLVYGILRALF
jgi:hypothetical protein